MPEWPRVTQILGDLGLLQGSPWYLPKHRRRGRIVDHCCNLLGQGKRIEADWWRRSSGETEEDKVEHEATRPFVEAYEKFLRETGFVMRVCALEVRNRAERYIGHIDQLGKFPDTPGSRHWPIEGSDLIDLKTGDEADWHKCQLGLYAPAVTDGAGSWPQRWNLYLTGDGKYRLLRRKDPRDIQQALTLARAWWVISQYKDWDFMEVE